MHFTVWFLCLLLCELCSLLEGKCTKLSQKKKTQRVLMSLVEFIYNAAKCRQCKKLNHVNVFLQTRQKTRRSREDEGSGIKSNSHFRVKWHHACQLFQHRVVIVTKYFKLSPFHGYNFKLPHLKLCRNTEFVIIHDQNFSHRLHLWDYRWHRKVLLQEDMNDTTWTLSLYTFKRQTYCQENRNIE